VTRTGLPDFGAELVEELVAAKVVVVPGRPFWTNAEAANAGKSLTGPSMQISARHNRHTQALQTTLLASKT
jgi:hypothetical protein